MGIGRTPVCSHSIAIVLATTHLVLENDTKRTPVYLDSMFLDDG